MGKRVERVRTYVSEPQMASAIISAWTELFGTQPTKEQVGMMLAQNALETGNRKSMWNYNVGNITTDGHGTFDFIDDLVPGLKFRSYPSLEEGTKDYLRLLHSKHYSGAWQHIVNPDPVAFSKALKSAGYYGEGSEAAYTKALTGLYGQFSKSDSYEKARAGQVGTASPEMIARKPSTTITPTSSFDEVLKKYIALFSEGSMDFSLKRLYKKALPNHDILIQVAAPDHISAVEFARILCAALDEDLLATTYTHTDGHLVEVECSIPGPAKECFEAVSQMTNAIADTFKDATSKIGGIKITANCIMNKKSSYQPISFRTADTNYRKFLLKFI